MQHETRKHARLSASRTDRFMSCPGSYRLESLMPYEPAGEAAAIGTAIHELSEIILRNGQIPSRSISVRKTASLVPDFWAATTASKIRLSNSAWVMPLANAQLSASDAISIPLKFLCHYRPLRAVTFVFQKCL